MIPAPYSVLGGSRAAASGPEQKPKPFDTRPTGDPADRLATQSLAVLAAAADVRCDDPRIELERPGLLAVVLDAGRELERALNAGLRQTLSEYRGSRSACDLRGTSAELRLALARFEATVESTATQLYRLVPDAADEPAIDRETPAGAATARSALRERSLDDSREPAWYEVSA